MLPESDECPESDASFSDPSDMLCSSTPWVVDVRSPELVLTSDEDSEALRLTPPLSDPLSSCVTWAIGPGWWGIHVFTSSHPGGFHVTPTLSSSAVLFVPSACSSSEEVLGICNGYVSCSFSRELVVLERLPSLGKYIVILA